MGFLGNTPAERFTAVTKDSFNGDGSTVAFTLSRTSSTNGVEVFVNNVQQEPTTAYSISGTTLTFTAAPATGTGNIYVLHRNSPVSTITHPSGSALEATNGTFTGNLTVSGNETLSGNLTVSGTISGNGSSLTSLPAANLTGTLPAIDGSNLTNLPGGGKVLQVVSGTLTSAFSTSSSSYVDTGLSATITPSSTSSKIMVLVTGQIDRPNTSYAAARFNLLRGSTSIWGGSGGNSYYSIYSSTLAGELHMSISLLDSPATTSATTYKVQLQSREGLATITFASAASSNQPANILLMEIAG